VPVLRKTTTAGRLSEANTSLLMQAVGVTLCSALKLSFEICPTTITGIQERKIIALLILIG
jgi:hypothetical protein